MTPTDLEALQTLVAKQAITEVLARYCRGVDRCDEETLKGIYWPDAVADYGGTPVPAYKWAEGLLPVLRGMERTMHSVSNILIEVDGDRAACESYCTSYHEFKTPEGLTEMIVGGRYLDKFEKRGGEWRVAHRRYVMDWNQNRPSTSNFTEGLYAGLKRHGKRFPDDPLYNKITPIDPEC